MADLTYDPYFRAAAILERFGRREGTLKRLCFEDEYRRKLKLYALTVETLKHKKLIDEVFQRTNVMPSETENSKEFFLRYVLVYEALFGKGIGINDKGWRTWIKGNKNMFQNAVHEITNSGNGMKVEGFALPRYARINTLRISSKDAMDCLCSMGFKLSQNAMLGDNEFRTAKVIPNLLVFKPEKDFRENSLYLEGKLIIQDMASCLPAFVLQPPPKSIVIDACAAPGNKASHLASIMGNEGIIYAIDRDQKRTETMRSMLNKANATCVKCINADFLKVDPNDTKYRHVEYILVDPSCSGSGIASRLDDLLGNTFSHAQDKERLRSLASFQVAALMHALSFPAVKRVVYSTCSIHLEENEEVVEQVLTAVSHEFCLAHILPEWKTRGLQQFDFGHLCLRASPMTDETNGFFVAMFQRFTVVDKKTKVRKRNEHKEEKIFRAMTKITTDLSFKKSSNKAKVHEFGGAMQNLEGNVRAKKETESDCAKQKNVEDEEKLCNGIRKETINRDLMTKGSRKRCRNGSFTRFDSQSEGLGFEEHPIVKETRLTVQEQVKGGGTSRDHPSLRGKHDVNKKRKKKRHDKIRRYPVTKVGMLK